MEFLALGGGNRIGASCYILKLAGKTIVVDCGFGFGRNHSVLPPPIEKISQRKIDLFLVTHAHGDHIGAAPALAGQHPEARIVMTEATSDIGELTLKDSLKIARIHHQQELFSEKDLDKFLERIKIAEMGEWFSPWKGWQVCFWPAGHMCGAASILIKSPECAVMFSGDISFNNTPMVEGAKLPPDFEPYLLITEATNGDLELPDRAAEVTRMVDKVKEVQRRGGHVLIPAFATERGPNVALELAEAGINVYTGGMINNVLRLFNVVDKNIVEIKRRPSPEDRTGLKEVYEVAKPGMPPSVVITTTGMMDFGLSNLLACAWVEDPKNAIIIPGYQAEEAFGRKVLAVEHGGCLTFAKMVLGSIPQGRGKKPHLIVREKVTKRVMAEVERFHLSGHSGASHMAAWISALAPMSVVMVHGERKSFRGLKRRIKDLKVTSRILVGEDGKTLTNRALCF